MEETDISKSVKSDNDFYKQMLDLIPPTFYFTQETRDRIKFGNANDEAYTEDQDFDDEEDVNNIEVGQKRQSSKPVSKAEIKRAKYDPSKAKTVTQIQEELIEREAPKAKKKKAKHREEEEVNLKSAGENLEHLREKLQHKIDSLKSKRKALARGNQKEKKQMKRRESKLRTKLKQKHQKDNKTKGLDKESQSNGMPSIEEKGSAKPVFNKEGKMVFSKFDFTDSGSKQKSDIPTGKNYTKLLEKVEKQKELMTKLKATDKEAAKTLQEKTAWKTALQKAEGIKVKDNPELLKKSIKKKEKLKQKSKKAWKEREEQVEEKLKGRQDKRQKNIKMRKQGRIDRKIKKSKNKGRTVPGF